MDYGAHVRGFCKGWRPAAVGVCGGLPQQTSWQEFTFCAPDISIFERDLRQCVALARPGRKVQQLGPTYLDIGKGDWKESVSALLSRASAAIMRLGVSESLRWELDAVVRSGKVQRTLFLSPAGTSGEEVEDLYDRLLFGIPDRPCPAFPHNLGPRTLGTHTRVLFFDQQGSAHVPYYAREKPKDILTQAKPFVEQLGGKVPKETVLCALDHWIGVILLVALCLYCMLILCVTWYVGLFLK